MLHASLALARRVDLAEIEFCARVARADQPGGARQLFVSGGRALCGKAGSPMNKVLGLGLGVEVSDGDLDAIDAFYDETGEPAQVELCPLASAPLAARLAVRGYEPKGFESPLARSVGPAPSDVPLANPHVVVAPISTSADDETWAQVIAAGFAAGEGSAHTIEEAAQRHIADMMRDFRHDTMTRYLASVDGRPVGGGASFVVDGVAGFVGTATIPAFRGRGVQHAVVTRMLRDVAGRADLGIATTEPGSRSQRTFERLGFQVIYTRSIWVRPFAAVS